MFELLIVAKMFLTAPHTLIGGDRTKIEARFGAPESVATDFRPRETDGAPQDKVVTLDWPQLRVRLYVATATKKVSLLEVATTSDLPELDGPIKIGASRNAVARFLGDPVYEDGDQIIYSLTQDDAQAPNETVRIVFKNDHVEGIDWTYPVQ